MLFDDHPDRDDKKVWLSQEETETLLDAAEDRQRELAYRIGARCGLRSHEVVEVAPVHISDTEAGPMLRVPEGKGSKFRQTPIPQDLATTIGTIDEYRDADSDVPLVDVSTRTLRRWIEDTRARLVESTGEQGWEELTMHDLRRTWATHLNDAEVDATLVMDWGGWEDIETFLDHYRGTHAPEAQRRERGKVDWL